MFCLKNAMRAVVEQHGSSIDIPPLKILITKGKQDLTIKVSGTCVKYDPKYYVFFFLSSYTTSQLLGLQRLKKSNSDYLCSGNTVITGLFLPAILMTFLINYISLDF